MYIEYLPDTTAIFSYLPYVVLERAVFPNHRDNSIIWINSDCRGKGINERSDSHVNLPLGCCFEF